MTTTSITWIFVKRLNRSFLLTIICFFLVFVLFYSKSLECEGLLRKDRDLQGSHLGFGAQTDLVANPVTTTFQTLAVGSKAHLLLLQTSQSFLSYSPTLPSRQFFISPRSLQNMFILTRWFLLMLRPSPHLLCILIWPFLEKLTHHLFRHSFSHTIILVIVDTTQFSFLLSLMCLLVLWDSTTDMRPN